ncbi:amidohydrolase family protein [Halovivax gelatinilyticus]|uniref:amidohydrolase family protein n=1 Tax=Halovivax gelatinilyticus TaxID=2961597 RepID=UPI0020CA7B57|nr:amidohydrolase family protein [Halovivax gelatinilyticus]
MLELEHGFRVVDVNARLTPGDEPWPRDRGRPISPERLERELHQAGIVRAVVSPNPRPGTSYLQANNGVARLSVDRPFVAFARINGPRPSTPGPASRFRALLSDRRSECTSPADVEQYAYDDRFHGFVLDPGVDGIPDSAVLDQLESVNLPLILSIGRDGRPDAPVESLLGRSFPIILSHFGDRPLDRESMASTIELLDRFDTCFFDTSFVRYRELLERALVEHPDRVFFGSGAPATHPNVSVMEILTLDVSEDLLRRAFSKNACRVIDALSPTS